jgi:molybdopterin-guanine dinucleotide biosynthesis protein A
MSREPRAATDGGLGGVILCGGQSRRMGRPKAWLPFEGEPLILRALRLVGEAAAPLVVVAAPDQDLPQLPEGVRLLRDPIEGQGPLQGLAVGLEALADEVPYAYVCSTDAPFLAPAFVRRMRALAVGHDVAVVRDDGHHHALGAVYATRLWTRARALIDADERRLSLLFERANSRIVDRELLLEDDALRQADPDLWSLRNLNRPEDYEAALRDAAARRSPPD